MAKIIKNTQATDVFVVSVGRNIPANSQVTLEVREYLLWASDAAIAEIGPKILAGDLVVNDGINDLSPVRGLDFLRYPDTAFNVRFLSDPERANGFTAKNVQEAIEEAVTGQAPISPTTTVGNVTAIAFTETLDDNTTYLYDARVVARRTDASGDHADFQILAKVKRENGGSAVIVGNIFQKRRSSTDTELQVDWIVSGNDIQLQVTGATGKTINWQPQIEKSAVK